MRENNLYYELDNIRRNAFYNSFKVRHINKLLLDIDINMKSEKYKISILI